MDDGRKFFGLREVNVAESSIINWKTITVNTGAAQSTLQDIKVPEYGSGYAYQSVDALTNNRYIFWRVSHNVVELWEESFDFDLTNNYLQIRFTDTPVLEGLSVHENGRQITILLATVSSVHKICLPHPLVMQDGSVTSIFSELSTLNLKEHHSSYVLNSSVAGETLPHTAATHLTAGVNGDALFVLGQPGGSLLLVRMTALPFAVHTHVLKSTSLVGRLFTGLVPGVFNKSGDNGESVTSVIVKEIAGESLALAICRDGRLRVWSVARFDCVTTMNPLEKTGEAGRKLSVGAHRHLIRCHRMGNSALVAVFLSFVEQQLIVVYEPKQINGQLKFNHIHTLYLPQFDMVDFHVGSSYVWSLWTDSGSDNEAQLICSSLRGSCDGLHQSLMEPSLEKDVLLTDPTLDHREEYLREIFASNRFSAHTIKKALGIYRRNVSSSHTEGTMSQLRAELESALNDEIRSRLAQLPLEASEEEIAEMSHMCWATFYSNVLQYHQVGQKPLGLFDIGSSGDLVGFVRKQCLSWMRPVSGIELLTLAPLDVITEREEGWLELAYSLRQIHEALGWETERAFVTDMFHLQAPDGVAEAVMESLLEGGPGGTALGHDLADRLAQIPGGLVSAIEALIETLRWDLGSAEPTVGETFMETGDGNEIKAGGKVLQSRLGAKLVGVALAQLARHRLELCRDLLLLQYAALQMAQQCRLARDDAAVIQRHLISQTVVLVQAYHALLCATTCAAVPLSVVTLDTCRRQLASLSMKDASVVSQFTDTADFGTVLELFFMGKGGVMARLEGLPPLGGSASMWQHALVPLVSAVGRLMWPINQETVWGEFLLWNAQYSQVQEYVRLLQPWCEWNTCTRQFMLGVSLLSQGEAGKASHLLVEAMKGVMTEDFFFVTLLGSPANLTQEQLKVHYCLRVIRLLEQSGEPLAALQVAQSGSNLVVSDREALAALQSVLFKHHLEFGHHDEAFTAMMACSDDQRRKNCLRQFVVTLHESGCLKTLVKYDYENLEPEMIRILENRARSADILVNNYYQLLYALNVSKCNYRKAASVMHECALRLNIEGVGKKGLCLQAKCYLSCMTCLRHLDAKNAWLAKPAPTLGTAINEGEGVSQSQKRANDGLGLPFTPHRRSQVAVLGLDDVLKEYELVQAQLKLSKVALDPKMVIGGPMSPTDTVALLTHARLFRDAVRLALLYHLPLSSIFQELALTCLAADQSPNKAGQWEWLIDNDMDMDTCGQESGVWWTLLQELLQKEEPGKQSILHQAVASALLQHTSVLPTWFIHSYKLRNPCELLRLYVHWGFLEEATQLSCQYIDAMLGTATEQMGLNNSLEFGKPSVWMPYTTLDKLLLELQEHKDKEPFHKLYSDLNEKLKEYDIRLGEVTKKILLRV